MTKKFMNICKINMCFDEAVDMILNYSNLDSKLVDEIKNDSERIHIFFDEENGMEVLVEF